MIPMERAPRNRAWIYRAAAKEEPVEADKKTAVEL